MSECVALYSTKKNAMDALNGSRKNITRYAKDCVLLSDEIYKRSKAEVEPVVEVRIERLTDNETDDLDAQIALASGNLISLLRKRKRHLSPRQSMSTTFLFGENKSVHICTAGMYPKDRKLHDTVVHDTVISWRMLIQEEQEKAKRSATKFPLSLTNC